MLSVKQVYSTAVYPHALRAIIGVSTILAAITIIALVSNGYRVQMQGMAAHSFSHVISRQLLSCTLGFASVKAVAYLLLAIEKAPPKLESCSIYHYPAALPAIYNPGKFKVGDKVMKGDVLAVGEWMKMEMSVRAPFSGTLKAIAVDGRRLFHGGESLFTIEKES